MEAMALGVPSIVSDMSCYDDYTVNNVNAIRFRNADVSDLTQKMSSLLLHEEYACKLGSEAAKSMKKFSSENVAMRYLKAFEIG